MTTLLLGLWLAAAAPASVELQLDGAQAEVLVGEPVRLTLTWRASKRTEVFLGSQADGFSSLQLWTDDGRGWKRYRESQPGAIERIDAPTPLAAGQEVFQDILLLWGKHGEVEPREEAFVLPRAGDYRVRIIYTGSGERAESNAIAIRAVDASGDEKEVLRLLTGEPNEVMYGGPKAQALLEKHPKSRYLRLARLESFRSQESRLLSHQDPQTGAPLGNMDAAAWNAFGVEHLRRLASEVLNDGDWGPFEDARLALAAEYARRGGDQDTEDRAVRELTQRFPRSAAAKDIKDRLARQARPPDSDDEEDTAPRPKATPKPKR